MYSKRKRDDLGESSKKQKTEDVEADSNRLEIEEKPSTSKKIDPNNHFKINLDLLQSGNAFKKFKRQEYKIVTVENCSNLVDAVKALTQMNFATLLNESKVLVFIVFVNESTFSNESGLIHKISEAIKMPMILQFNYEDTRSIFYQETNEGFKKLKLMEGTRIEEVSLSRCIDFETMCNFLHSKSNFGKFNFNLIETEIAMEKSFCGLRLIDWAVRHKNMLCLLFLRLFNPDLESLNDNSTRTLEVAAESGTLKCFEILLNFEGSDC